MDPSTVFATTADWAKANPYAWMAAGVLIYDAIEQRIKTGTFGILLAGPFWTYTLYHLLLGSVALWLIPGEITSPISAGLLTALSTEAIIANADIKFGGQSLLPLAEQFIKLRAKIQAELGARQETQMLRLRDQLAKLPAAKLEEAWIAVFIDPAHPAATQEKLDRLRKEVESEPIRNIALAAQMVLEKPVYVKASLSKWVKT